MGDILKEGIKNIAQMSSESLSFFLGSTSIVLSELSKNIRQNQWHSFQCVPNQTGHSQQTPGLLRYHMSWTETAAFC